MKLEHIEIVSDKEIKLFYENGEIRLLDLSPWFKGDFMGELRNPDYFRKAKIFPLTEDTICWPRGQDITPHEVYEMSRKVST